LLLIPHHDADPRILKKEFLPLRDRGNCMNVADYSGSCRRILVNFLRGGLPRFFGTRSLRPNGLPTATKFGLIIIIIIMLY